jgi:ABC-type spermidine/putrescine transport system permease subunit II
MLAGGLLLILIAWMWFPLFELGLMSVSRDPYSGVPNSVTGKWYSQLFTGPSFAGYLRNSLELAVLVGLLVAVGGVLVSRHFRAIKRKGLFILFVVMPMFIPGLVLGFSLLVYADVVGFPLGWRTLAAAHLIWAFPFGFLSVLIAMTRLDVQLLEAASDLGASRWEVLRDIELPLIRPGIVAAFLFGFLLSFNELSRSILTAGQVTTLPLYVWAENSSHSTTVPLVYALTTLIMLASFICVGVAYTVLFRRARRSMLVKGV